MSSSVISANGDPAPGTCTFFISPSKDLVQLVGSLLYPQPHQTERGTGIEDHHQDDPSADDADVQVVFLSLVKEDRELFLRSAGETAGGRDVAGGERGERRGIEVLGGADEAMSWPFLSTRKTIFGVGLPRQALADRADLLEFLVVHHHLRCIRETSS